MIATLTKPSISPEELLEMPDAGNYELVDGQLVEKNVSTLSCLVEGIVHVKVSIYADTHRLGLVWPGTQGFQCFPGHPRKVRKPDVSFVKAERFTPELLDTGFLPIAPDLAVEVISPGDLAHELVEKTEEYRQAGVALVWIIDPVSRLLDVFRKDGSSIRLRETDELTADDVLPGFRCRVSDLFPAPAQPTIA